MKKKIIVLGGSGFLGNQVSLELLNNGYDVWIYDKIKKDNVDERLHYIKGDILDKKKLNSSIRGKEYVFNFAGLSSLDSGLSRPLDTINQNILGNFYVLDSCKINKVKKFVYASTIYVNSNRGGFYRCSKQSAELYIKEFSRKYKIDFTILRYGSLYGPQADSNNSLYNIISKAIQKKKIVYEGSSKAVREYIHIYDAAKATVKTLDKFYKNKTVLITGKESLKVSNVLEMVAEILNYKNKIYFKNLKDNNHYDKSPYSYEPDYNLKYSPNHFIDLGQGIFQIINKIKNSN